MAFGLQQKARMTLTLTSPSFKDGSAIPKIFTGEAEDRSPELEWSSVSNETREFALICVDPDAPSPEPWVHWLIYNISPSTTRLPEGLAAIESLELPIRADQGVNSFGRVGYGGPMPPAGHGWHHYTFTLYALDTELALDPGADIDQLRKAMRNHIIGRARLTGRYRREAEQKIA